ncbi:hypothetical protein IFR04_006022 [Cadophora malorum]|uniref:Uncharacterized protein n=1 Tax=Cadophora malorum TaxID=108018 RepID=A0A8H7TFU0_9HELO|nr:hypothetical protein IFR04_006022 [Cadophora malorum]
MTASAVIYPIDSAYDERPTPDPDIAGIGVFIPTFIYLAVTLFICACIGLRNRGWLRQDMLNAVGIYSEVYELETLTGKYARRNSVGNVFLYTRPLDMAAGAADECGYMRRRDTEENVGEQIEIPNMPSFVATPIAEDRSA